MAVVNNTGYNPNAWKQSAMSQSQQYAQNPTYGLGNQTGGGGWRPSTQNRAPQMGGQAIPTSSGTSKGGQPITGQMPTTPGTWRPTYNYGKQLDQQYGMFSNPIFQPGTGVTVPVPQQNNPGNTWSPDGLVQFDPQGNRLDSNGNVAIPNNNNGNNNNNNNNNPPPNSGETNQAPPPTWGGQQWSGLPNWDQYKSLPPEQQAQFNNWAANNLPYLQFGQNAYSYDRDATQAAKQWEAQFGQQVGNDAWNKQFAQQQYTGQRQDAAQQQANWGQQFNFESGLARDQFGEGQRQFNQNFGEGQRQFNVGQGNWTQNFIEGQRQFNTGQENWGRQFNEGTRQFNVGQGNWQQQFGEGQRQFNTQFGEDTRRYNQDFGEGQRQFNTQFGEGQRQFNVGQGNWQSQFGEDQRQFNRQQGLAELQNTQQFGLQNQQFGEGQRQFNVNQAFNQQQFGEGQRQFNTQFGEGQRQFNTQMDFERVKNQQQYGLDVDNASLNRLVQTGQLDLSRQQFGEGQRQFNQQFGLQQQQFGENTRQFDVSQAQQRELEMARLAAQEKAANVAATGRALAPRATWLRQV